MADELFHGHGDLSDALNNQAQKMRSVIGDTSAERMNGATDDELVAHFVSEYQIEPLTIYDDQAEATHKETKIDVSYDRLHRYVPNGSGPVMVQGDQITVHVPFVGDSQLFNYKPSTRNFSAPRGRVTFRNKLAGTVIMTLALPSDTNDGSRFNTWIKEQLEGLKKYETWVRNDVMRYNNELDKHAREAICKRRTQLEKQGLLLKKLSIPLRAHPDAPSPSPIPMPKRVVKPLPPARMVEQEYGINEADYEYILKIIRQESRSFESTPGAFIKLSEEELRDVVLAHLNGHFEGDASGERFRKKGKTDICIEYGNRAAFVAECKLWKGQKMLCAAIDQLLGYLTWRDTQTALIVWNKSVKDFAKLQSDMPQILKTHSRFIRELGCGQVGEWRGVFRSEVDNSREIVVHFFLVDLSSG